jgi:hypothetical protein
MDAGKGFREDEGAFQKITAGSTVNIENEPFLKFVKFKKRQSLFYKL